MAGTFTPTGDVVPGAGISSLNPQDFTRIDLPDFLFGLSIVVPTRDTRELTRRCLASLAPLGAAEILVVDDGTTDGTVEALAPLFPAVRWLRNESPRGFGGSVNRGLTEASGDLLLLLNSDTERLEGDAARLAARFARDPRLGALGARLRNPDGSPQWSGGREPTLAWSFALGSGLPALFARSALWGSVRPVSGAGGIERRDSRGDVYPGRFVGRRPDIAPIRIQPAGETRVWHPTATCS